MVKSVYMKLESVTCEYVCLSRLNQISCILFQIGPFFLYGINVSTELYSTIYIHLAYRSPIYCDRTNNLQYQKLYYSIVCGTEVVRTTLAFNHAAN